MRQLLMCLALLTSNIWSSASSAIPYTNIMCNAPTLLTATNATTTTVELAWTSTNFPQETSWEIEIIEAGNTFTGIPTHTNIISNPFVINNLQAHTRYCFRVRALCGAGRSGWSSAQQCFETNIINPPPCGLHFPIQDNNCGTGNTFPILVNDAGGTILGTDVILSEVRLLINHNWEQDLRIRLSAPDGSQVNLTTDNGGAGVHPPYGVLEDGSCNAFTTFKNSDIACFEYPFIFDGNLTSYVGDFLPEMQFNNFDGKNPNGTWTLHICDDAAVHTGTLEYIELVFDPVSCPPPTMLSVTDIETTTATVSWLSGTANTLANIEVAMTNAPNEPALIFNNVSAPFDITNLSVGTDYHIQIYEHCPNGELMPTLCPMFFTTQCTTDNISEIENFDSQNACGNNCSTICPLTGIWKNASTSSHWLTHQNTTPTLNTGPSHDFGGNGKYIYVESTNGTCQNQTAILQSDCIEVLAPTADCHFSFAYSLFGFDVQSLRLEIRPVESANWQSIWNISGNQGRFWKQAFIDLSAFHQQTVQLRFVVTTGAFDTGDIALDELTFYGSTHAGTPLFVHYQDDDNDGYGVTASAIVTCAVDAPTGYTPNDGDCDDTNPFINPAMPEIHCNQIDENCNGLLDDAILPSPTPPLEQSICPNTSVQLAMDEPSIGEYQWFDAEIGGDFLISGDNFTSPVLTNNDTFYVEDVLTVQPGLRLTEVFLSFTGSALEIQNIGIAQDYSNWKIIISDDNSNINNPISVAWELGFMGDNEIQTRNRNNWGTSFTWLSIWKGWAILVDDQNNISDAIFWNWNTADINAFNIEFENINYTAADLPWTGSGISVTSGCGQSLSLTGNFETDSATDYVCTSNNLGSPNTSLNLARTCRSPRTPIVVRIHELPTPTVETLSRGCDENGSIFLNLDDTAAPYTFTWNNTIITEQHLVGTAYGSYSVTITDTNTCTTEVSNIILSPPPQKYRAHLIEKQDVSCFNARDGFLIAQIDGGIPPFQYNWSAGKENDITPTIDTLKNLSGGNYNVTITDGQGCVDTSDTMLILEPNALQLVNLDIQHIECFNANDGQIALTIAGGTPPYAYHWSLGEGSAIQNHLSSGTYQVTVNDSQNCQLEINDIVINAPLQAIELTIEVEHITCFGANDGRIKIITEGGIPPYTYAWDNVISDASILNNLGKGNYQVTITDANDCTLVSPIIIVEEANAAIQIDIEKTDVACQGQATGSITLTAIGGVSPYEYLWSNSQNTASIQDLAIGTYICTIIDAFGCVEITNPIAINSDDSAAFSINIASQIPPTCHDSMDGSIELTASGGLEPINYHWNNGMENASLHGLDGGIYQCTVTDANACTALSVVELEEPLSLIISNSDITNDIGDTQQGQISIDVMGGTPPYEYQWDDPFLQQSPICANLPMGVYTVTVSDANNCSYTQSFYVGNLTATQDLSPIPQMYIQPNPAQDRVQITVDLAQNETLSIHLYSIDGRKIHTEVYEHTSQIDMLLDVQNLPVGVYFVQVHTGKAIRTERLMIQR